MKLEFDDKIKNVLTQYHKRIEMETALSGTLSFEERNERIDEFLLPVGEATGMFLNEMVKSSQSKIILELGTSYGYSTIWLAEAARVNDGKIITMEMSNEKANYAQQKIKEAGLSEYVEFRVGNALEYLATATEIFDFVLLDIWKELYVPCFDLFFPKLNKDAWVIADNMIYPPHSHAESAAYRIRVKETNDFNTILLPIGSGLELSQFKN